MAKTNQATLLRKQLFISCGLTEKEAVLYDVLLRMGEGTAAELERESGFKKNTYALVRALLRKNLIILKNKDGKEVYQTTSPDALLSLIKTQEAAMRETRMSLEKMLPTLQSQYALTVGKPTIRYFEGETGIEEVFSDIYGPKTDPVYGCVDLEMVDTVFPHHVLRDLIPLRVKNNIFAYSLVANSLQAKAIQSNDARQLRKTILLDKTQFPLPAEIDVYEDKIAMLSFERGKFIGIIIQNAAFAQSLKSIFKAFFASVPSPIIPSGQEK